MQSVRIVLTGLAPGGQREEFATVVSVTALDRDAGLHLDEAQFRAGVRGLAGPWCVLADYEIARVEELPLAA